MSFRSGEVVLLPVQWASTTCGELACVPPLRGGDPPPHGVILLRVQWSSSLCSDSPPSVVSWPCPCAQGRWSSSAQGRWSSSVCSGLSPREVVLRVLWSSACCGPLPRVVSWPVSLRSGWVILLRLRKSSTTCGELAVSFRSGEVAPQHTSPAPASSHCSASGVLPRFPG